MKSHYLPKAGVASVIPQQEVQFGFGISRAWLDFGPSSPEMDSLGSQAARQPWSFLKAILLFLHFKSWLLLLFLCL